MLQDRLDVALHHIALTPAQVLHLLDQVVEIELAEPACAQQRGLAFRP